MSATWFDNSKCPSTRKVAPAAGRWCWTTSATKNCPAAVADIATIAADVDYPGSRNYETDSPIETDASEAKAKGNVNRSFARASGFRATVNVPGVGSYFAEL